MRNLIFTFLLICLSNFAFAQNWQPIIYGNHYNYKKGNAAFITNTIFADSLNANGNDTTFYLNRIYTKCDTCTAALGGINPCDSCYGLKNQPQFLMRSMIKHPNAIYVFNDTSQFIIDADALLNDSWMFDSVSVITATVADVGIKSVFTTTDSVKTILLSTGDTILLSKNFGIIQFGNYALAGIEGSFIAGEKVPGFWEIYNFNVGDVFYYSHYFVDGSIPVWAYWNSQHKVISKTMFANSISYTMINWYYNYPGKTCDTTTSVVVDSVNDFSNGFNNQYVLNGNYIGQPSIIYNHIFFSLDTNSVFTKQIGSPNSIGSMLSSQCLPIDSISDVLNLLDWNNALSYYGELDYVFKNGLGMTDYNFTFFEVGSSFSLIGYIKNGDTVGVINSMHNIDLSPEQISVFPNPAFDFLKVKLNTTIHKYFNVRIFDSYGKLISSQQQIESQFKIETQNFKNGIYFLLIEINGNVMSKKFLVEH